jgi:beta-glucosidase
MLAGNDLAGGVDADSIVQSVNNGSIPEAVVRDHATRIVAAQYNINGDLSALPLVASAFYEDVREPSTKDIIRTVGANSITLLKNIDGTLPLTNPKIIGVFGENAANLGGGPTWLEEVESFQGDTYASHLVSGGGSGRAPQPYIVSPLDALTTRASTGKGFSINYILANTWQVEAPPAPWWEANVSTTIQINAEAADTCIVFINAFSKEGVDRRALSVDDDDQLVQNVARFCDNTIVVLNTAGARIVEAWIDNPNVTVSPEYQMCR